LKRKSKTSRSTAAIPDNPVPELPEVEIHARSLREWLVGRTVRHFEVLDPLLVRDQDISHWPEALAGHAVLEVRRLAKYLFVDLEGGATVVAHLRMTGRFARDTYVAGPTERPTRFVLDLDDQSRVRFEDRRRFGRIWVVATGEELALPELAGIGPDALLEPLNGDQLHEITQRSGRTIKTLLMDQRVIGGIGNIYASEILYQAGVPPDLPSRELSAQQASAIARITPEYLRWAIDVQGRRDLIYLGEKGAENVFHIYRREGTPCPKCGSPIVRTVTGGRGTYSCPTCQSREADAV
jgi:formamidopyrimidine-DNA glycosylase